MTLKKAKGVQKDQGIGKLVQYSNIKETITRYLQYICLPAHWRPGDWFVCATLAMAEVI